MRWRDIMLRLLFMRRGRNLGCLDSPWDHYRRHRTRGFSGDGDQRRPYRPDNHVEGLAETGVDASGLVIAPVCVDVHTPWKGFPMRRQPKISSAWESLQSSWATAALRCLSVADFFRALAQTNVSINVATLIGHNAVRKKSWAGRPCVHRTTRNSPMKLLVEQAMKDGAVGFSTGLIYLPANMPGPKKSRAGQGGCGVSWHLREPCS